MYSRTISAHRRNVLVYAASAGPVAFAADAAYAAYAANAVAFAASPAADAVASAADVVAYAADAVADAAFAAFAADAAYAAYAADAVAYAVTYAVEDAFAALRTLDRVTPGSRLAQRRANPMACAGRCSSGSTYLSAGSTQSHVASTMLRCASLPRLPFRIATRIATHNIRSPRSQAAQASSGESYLCAHSIALLHAPSRMSSSVQWLTR